MFKIVTNVFEFLTIKRSLCRLRSILHHRAKLFPSTKKELYASPGPGSNPSPEYWIRNFL